MNERFYLICFKVIVISFYLMMVINIKEKFNMSAKLISEARDILNKFETKGFTQKNENYHVIIMNTELTKVFVDTLKGIFSESGDVIGDDQNNLLESADETKIKYVHNLFEEAIMPIAITKKTDKQYCVIVYVIM